MRSTQLRASLCFPVLAASLLFANSLALAQSTVSLTARPTSTTLPDGQTVPMWGYACGAVSAGVSCTGANGQPQPAAWRPPLITVPSGQSLTITLTNQLTFPTLPAGNPPTNVPTSLVIVGQLGGGLGSNPARMPVIPHEPQGTTWPGTRGDADPTACLPGGNPGEAGTFCPPDQAARVRSFATEIAAGGSAALTWTAANLRPGTYLIESGTQPSIQGPMGLYGVLVVTDPAYPGQTFDASVALLLSEIDPAQNATVDGAVRTAGFSDALVWNGQQGECGDPAVNTCYPPAVNYSPRYYLINGISFDRSNSLASALPVAAAGTQGRVLLRFVNGGLRMHVPTVVGADMTLLAEDGNRLPGIPKVQSVLFLAAGKTTDVTIQPRRTAAGTTYESASYAVYDRELSLSTNNVRDGGMRAYVRVAGGALPVNATVAASNETYYCVAGTTLAVTDPGRGVLANDSGANGAVIGTISLAGGASRFSFQSNGTFTYTQLPADTTCGGTFTYRVNGTALATATITQCDATAAGSTCAALGGAPVASADAFASNVASRLQISPPGVLTNDRDPSGFPLRATALSNVTGGTVTLNADGSFVASPTTPPTGAATATVTFQYSAINAQNRTSTLTTATVTFGGGSGLVVNVRDARDPSVVLEDYRWIIEEDRSVYVDPAAETLPRCTGSSPPLTPPACSDAPVRNLAVNFHTSNMPVVATGCTGPLSCETGQTLLGEPTVCDVGNGSCRPGTQKAELNPSQVVLDPAKRYYISVLPGDGANDTEESSAHGMGGAPIATGQGTVDISVQPLPLPPAKISVFVFEDDNPLNGENDTGGGVDQLAPNEAGLGGFSIVLMDKTGQFGDPAGQLTYDEFGMPVSNALAGTIDPATGLDACPISPASTDGLVGMIITCPTFESDGVTLSPLAGHAVIANMYPGLYEVHTTPAADRVARGEEWLQTNTLDGTKDIEAFIKPDEPSYFQEFGPGGFHVAVGFANPERINARRNAICATPGSCPVTLNGRVTNARISRTPDQRVYSSGSYESYSFGNCYVSLGDPDRADFAFTKCDADGNFSFVGVPAGNLKVTVFDQWNDLLVDGLSTPVRTAPLNVDDTDNANCSGSTCFYEIPVTQWRTNLYGRIFLDQDNDGVSQESEPGLPLVPYNIRYRDGSYMGFNNTDLAGFAGFNEVFPFLNWLVVDTDSARYKQTGVHVVYDAGGPVDPLEGDSCLGDPGSCGTSAIGAGFANTRESPTAHIPTNLRVPGARYCAEADCPAGDPGFDPASNEDGSTGRVDPGWVPSEGWQGLLGQNSFIDFAMQRFGTGENGGIRGHVIYTTTRPFDDPALLLQLSWEPGMPNVTINLYQEGTAPDGSKALRLVDTTKSTSWDDWAQGFRSDGIPNMNCPGQESDSPFYFTLENTTQWLNPATPVAANSRFKCYDGWSMLNAVQPAPYDGMYRFPSIVGRDPVTGAPTGVGTAINPAGGSRPGSNCTICVANPLDGTPMLPAGKYVVEVVLPNGYELVKEEDKNILLGDVYIAPVTQQFAGFGNIYILPDQAAINAYYNSLNALQSTTNNGATPRREGDTGSVEVFWPCVGAVRVIPDFNSLFPGAEQAAPFAGASRPLCDRKQVTLQNEMTVLAKFYLFTSAHVTGRYTGTITNDFAGEFDPFSPQFGEKAAVPNSPVAFRDYTGKEISRVYADQWGRFNGLTYSTWTVNPPSPSGYIPQMMIACMNDPGPIPDPTGAIDPTTGQVRMITDPWYNPAYSNFCYETPFMPGQTQYMDTPVIPTMAFAASYNLPDCDYPDTTPAIASVIGDSALDTAGTINNAGPWVTAAGRTLTINALGDKRVLNHAYSGPRAEAFPFNQKFITRHYGFGNRCTTPTAGSATCNTQSSVTIAGVPATITGWNDSQITVTVPALSTGQSTCTMAQRTTPAAIGQSARCGQLVITAGNGKQSIDSVTVTIAGSPPTYVRGENATGNALQSAIDNALPGDLIIVGPGTYREMLLMWKPVRLQGVGATSVTIDADAHPAGKLDPWRRQINCLFGLTAQGRPATTGYDGCAPAQIGRVDRVPREGIIGWDTTTNGNLAEQLQEPTLFGAYEGAGITVLGRGFRFPVGTDRFSVGTEGVLPDGSSYLTSSGADCARSNTFGRDFGTSNFRCNPARVDGVSIINSSQGGGGLFAHGWNHFLEVSNTRVYANHGTLSGGISIGPGEFTVPYIVGGVEPIPFTVPGGTPDGTQLGYGLNSNVHVHHNAVTSNASLGDALYSNSPSAAGGVTFCTGSDNYLFNFNWICGNLSSGDGGGVAHLGFSNDSRMERNSIIFNQSATPTIPVNGGGLAILAAAPDRTLPNGDECGTTNDLDCPPGLPEGTGRNLTIDANLILGNSAESGTGGGLLLQGVNGNDVIAFPTRPNPITTGPVANRSPGWNNVTITNNIIGDNVAGWDGGGVTMQDALRVRFVNNTVISNDTTASAGVLFNTLGAPNTATPPPGCNPQPDPTQPQDPSCINPVTTSTNQAAGLVVLPNSPNLVAALPPNGPGTQVACPTGFGYGTGTALNDGLCRIASLPLLTNNLFWRNRAFRIEVGDLGESQQNQQRVVTLVPSLDQGDLTGFCAAAGVDNGAPGSGGPVNYWDIGVRGDTTPAGGNGLGAGGADLRLSPTFSIMTSTAGYTGAGLLSANPLVIAQYCNGSRLPPEGGGLFAGFEAPPGRSETTGLYPVFALNQITPAATVDEGNNWINLSYGPLSLSNAALYTAPNTALAPLGNYSIQPTSPAASVATNAGVFTDFFGNTRPQGAGFDIGAVEIAGAPPPPPALAVLDNFDRTAANTLGTNWQQLVVAGNSGIRVNNFQAFCINNGTVAQNILCVAGANAYWNSATGGGPVFGATQAAAFTFANATLNNTALSLKAGGTFSALGFYPNVIRVRYSTASGGQVIVETATNGIAFTAQATFAGAFVTGDRLTARVDASGTVSVWRTSGATNTLLGQIALPTATLPFTTGTGRIGLFLPPGGRVDDFAAGTVP